MQKQIFYTYKFKSSRLAEFNFEINDLSFEQAKKNKEIISLFDSQLLRSVRHVKKQEVDYELVKNLKKEISTLKRKDHSKETVVKINKLQKQLNELLFVPEIISIVMENKSHYRHLFKNKLKVNGKFYRRLSCSAGQARVSTVIFCECEMADKLDVIFDNGRDKNKELVPSKFNAYKGLITSSTSVVSTPSFCLVPDYESPTEVKVNFVTETPLNEDDIITEKTITEMFNRFDGQGLVSIEQARIWAEELELDYIPSQWCIRQNYIKGMLSTFDIKAFCKEKNNGNYLIETSYKDEHGNSKLADLSKVDVIISESQFKLWSSFSSIEEYQSNCEKNDLQWGISLVSPKKDKDILRMNYQFLQTLHMNQKDVENICDKFVKWINGVTHGDVYKTILFLLGSEVDEDKIKNYLENSENHWVKALIADNYLINDKWVKKKVYDTVKKKIKNGCLGGILTEGNFQVLVSDPYAQMQHACGLEVNGLLGEKEYYSNYWNKKKVKVVDSMRAPLTYRSEHVLLNLKSNDELNKWYKYNTSGIIVNVHGHETMNWAGSDFDMDIIATTSDETVIKGVYKDELPVAYEPPKSTPQKLTERRLYNADLHSFGSEIGQITNKSTSGYALLAQLEEGTEEYETTMNRVKMCTKLQSAQIDKAKIGRKVKSIPSIWLKYNRVEDTDTPNEIKEKEFLNRILLNKHPYFFTYLYKNTRRKYKQYYQNQNATCLQKFGISIDELKSQKRKTTEQMSFLESYELYSPVIDSDCTMNLICRYIESIDFNIRNVIKQEETDIHMRLLSDINFTPNEKIYKKIKKVYEEFKISSENLASTTIIDTSVRSEHDEHVESNINMVYDEFKSKLEKICSNVYNLTDYLIHMFYVDNTGLNKEVLWNLYGEYIYDNVKIKVNKTLIPVPSENGEIDYLDKKYMLKEVVL